MDSAEAPPNSYDELPYDSHPYSRTHPDHLATLARLFGLKSPEVDRCRILELGCASGGNLIPMAISLPGSTCLGIDLSQRQLAQGRQLIERLGLTNVRLEHRNISQFGAEKGEFDYIVCHGVYSWVPDVVQERILEICRDHLAPNGVAYISYNTYPGWFLRGMVRQMLCFHARQFADPQTQVGQARALLDFLSNAGPASDETYHVLLKRELEVLQQRKDSYLFHEHLEEFNTPVFFYQFMERAEAKGLRYLSEVQFSEMVPTNFAPDVVRTLRTLGTSIVHSEQYMDFLRNRTFRRTLLCHAGVELNRDLGPQQLRGLQVASQLRPEVPDADLQTSDALRFQSPAGPTVTLSAPSLKKALVRLYELWPRGAPFEQLPALARGPEGAVVVRTAAHHAEDLHSLGGLILELYSQDLVELRLNPLRFQLQPAERPLASPLARWQALQGEEIVSLRHELLALTDLERAVLRRLDGTQDVAAIHASLLADVAAGQLVVQRAAIVSESQPAVPVLTVEMVRDCLQVLARYGLLIG